MYTLFLMQFAVMNKSGANLVHTIQMIITIAVEDHYKRVTKLIHD